MDIKATDLLTSGEAAKALGVTRPTIRQMVDRGELPGFRIPRDNSVRVSRPAVEALRAKAGLPMP